MKTAADLAAGWRGAHIGVLRAGTLLRIAAVLVALSLTHLGAAVGPDLIGGLSALRTIAPPPPAAGSPVRNLTDARPVVVLTTRNWKKVAEHTTADAVLHDRALWRRMHFEDWDTAPPQLRRRGLSALVRANRRPLGGIDVWRAMSATDWDAVPQPVRAIAYLRMVWYWARVERVGAEFGMEPSHVAQTIGAIVMTESWFEHRAVNVNPWGNRDVGLAQCSDYCREELAAMARRGEIAFAPSDTDYVNPLMGTRVATVWFQRELRRADGDLEIAIRAYHRGIERAMDQAGDAYLGRVISIRAKYIRNNPSSSPSWGRIVQEVREPSMDAGPAPEAPL